jgi:ketosteroid isomerase-like protein
VRHAVAFVALAGVALATGRSLPAQEKGSATTVTDTALRKTADRFVEAADKGDAVTIAAIYDDAFTCVRVADDGGFATLSRDQMLAFFKRPASPGGAAAHTVPTKETKVHHVEVIGDTGYVLLTRVKDLGSGWEPMHYTLVWKRQGDAWRLLREFVSQKSTPKWK